LNAKTKTFGNFLNMSKILLGDLKKNETKNGFFQAVGDLFRDVFDRPEFAWWELRRMPNNWYEVWNVEFNERK
jgi:hypothetical protein